MINTIFLESYVSEEGVLIKSRASWVDLLFVKFSVKSWQLCYKKGSLMLLFLFQLSKFLQFMQERGLISVQEASKGVDHITAIAWDHPE